MKKITMILMALSLVSHSILAQVDTSTKVYQPLKLNADNYMKKAKIQQTIAWSMIGGGFVTSIIGSVIWPEGYAEGIIAYIFTLGLLGEETLPTPEEQRKASLSLNLIITGMALIISSTPFFISSAKNKKKASLLLKNEHVMLTPNNKSGYQMNQVGITIHFNP